MVVVAALGTMAFAAGATTTTVPASGTPSVGVTGSTDVMVAGTTSTVTMAGVPTTVTPETAAIINEIRALRAEIRATTLEVQGQMLVSRINDLAAREMIFRQIVSTTTLTPEQRMMAMQLQAEAMALNSDVVAYNQTLNAIPADQRPYLAQRLNTFDVVYWQPATQQFVQYRTNFQQNSPTAYQPAFANNAWLQNWHAGYTTSLNTLGTSQQTFASTRWWTTTASIGSPTVLGTTEMYPGSMSIQPGSAIVLPAGTVIIVPPTSASTSTMGTTSTTTATGAAVTNGYPAATGAP
jgi:hypothetical protein